VDWGALVRLIGKQSPAILLVALALAGALVGWASDFDGTFPALGGPNAPLYDATLYLSSRWRRDASPTPVVFVAVDEKSLTRPDLVKVPRALMQPFWAKVIDGLLANGARRVAFDLVLAYAGSDFQAGGFQLSGYDDTLIDAVRKGHDKIILGRFPTLPVASAFESALGRSRVGSLNLQAESDGRVRSTITVARQPDGRISLGFAALASGWGVREATGSPRILIAPTQPLGDTLTMSLGDLLDCLATADGEKELQHFVSDRVAVVGVAILGEDEHLGPVGLTAATSSNTSTAKCAPYHWADRRWDAEPIPGALLQIAAIQSASRPVQLAPPFWRAVAGAVIALFFGWIALRDDIALTSGEAKAPLIRSMALQLVRLLMIGIAGPVAVGLLMAVALFNLADLWLPTGYPLVTAGIACVSIIGLRWGVYRATLQRLYRSFGRYMPPQRLAELAHLGFEDNGKGRERTVTILLTDIVGFTAFSNDAGRTATQVVEVANRYFTIIQEIIDRYGGCSDKFLGDAVLAFWNGFAEDREHASKGVLAGRDILRAIDSASPIGGERLTARVVVCSGQVFIGDLGADRRRNFTIIGPAVNEVFRLEKLPDRYGMHLLLAQSTASFVAETPSDPAVTDGFSVERLDDVALKGFTGLRSVYGLVPIGDPGLASFRSGRQALDRRDTEEAARQLASVRTGVLVRAARVLIDSMGADTSPRGSHHAAPSDTA
jgi:class 3 adenylate cyclase